MVATKRSAVRGVLAALAVCMFAAGSLAGTAHADRTSGSWTGNLHLRGNYYWEQSTRVIAPSAGIQLEAPNGVRVGADYLVDSITSASQAVGLLEDIRFTEVRHQVGFNTGYELELGEMQLDLSASFNVSREPDYLSVGGGIAAALSLADHTTTLRLGLNFSHEDIHPIFRSGAGVHPADQMGGRSVTGDDAFEVFALSVGWEQILSPVMYFQVSYQYGYLDGFLANAYRAVLVNDVLRPEAHPETRHRHTVTGRLAYHLRATNTSFHVIYRAYLDSWDVGALTPEIRIYQQIARPAYIRLRWRHYTQTQSFFYQDSYDRNTPDGAYVTFDPKMSEFHNNLLGFQFLLKGNFLDGTALEALRDATLDISVDYLWNTNRFGNGVIGEVGLTVPF